MLLTENSNQVFLVGGATELKIWPLDHKVLFIYNFQQFTPIVTYFYSLVEEGKDQESIQSSTTPDPVRHNGK